MAVIKFLATVFAIGVLTFIALWFVNPESVPFAVEPGVSTIQSPLVDYKEQVYAKDFFGVPKQAGMIILRVGESVTLYAETSNIGRFPATRPTTTWAAGRFFRIPALLPGRSVTKSFDFTCLGEGRALVEAYADYYGELADNNMDDNRAYLTMVCLNK